MDWQKQQTQLIATGLALTHSLNYSNSTGKSTATGLFERMAESFLVLLIFSVIPLTHQSGTRQIDCGTLIKEGYRSETIQETKILKGHFHASSTGSQGSADVRDLLLNYYWNICYRLDFTWTCWSPTVLHFSNYRNLVHKNILLDLRIGDDCKPLMQNLAVWANAIDLRSIELKVNLHRVMGSTQGNENLTSNFKDIVYLQTSINPSMLIDADEEIFWPNKVKLLLKTQQITSPSRDITVLQQQLSLSFSSVKEPPEFPWNSTLDFFQCMRNLYRPTLSLDYNNIGDLSSHIFRRLQHSLRLQENGLKAVGPSCFRNLEGIHAVNLSYNNLVSLPETLFHGLTSLRYIFLTGNNLSFLKPKLFQGLKNVKRIDLNDNNLNHIPKGLFSSLNKLEFLNLANNKITAIDKNIFPRHYPLKRLLLQNNYLSAIPTWFSSLNKLEFLNLANNKITAIDKNIFPRHSPLKRLLLQNNYLSAIPTWFSSLNKLEFLNLTNNKITAIDKNIFPRHSPLKRLLLQNNYLSAIPTWIFNLTKIEVIDLSSNRITGLQGLYKAMEGTQLRSLVRLNLENNNITTLRIPEQFKRKAYYMNQWFFITFTVNTLYCDCVMSTSIRDIKIFLPEFDFLECGWPHKLKKKPIFEVKENQWMSREEPENCPAECVCLKRCSDETIVINCEGKSLKELPRSLPQGLIELNLRNNEIKDIRPYPYLTNVTVLKLSNNTIDELQVSTLKNLKHIETLLIDSNQLTSLPRDIETMNFKTLALDQNLFKCDCKIKWMKHWLLKNKHRIKDFKKVACASGHTAGHQMFSLADDKFVCPPARNETSSVHRDEKRSPLTGTISASTIPTGTIMAIILGSLLLLIMIVAILLYKYHGEMKVFMFTHFNWHPFDRIDDSDPTKIYDAFISYSGDDHQWVVETLQQRLENHDPPYKLCFHYRDFRAGAPIVENILKSVDHSKRMLMVLSPSFARSGWCLLEFRAAHRKVIEDRMNYLIIILLDDVNMAELDEEIKLYMRTNTYVSYSDNWFWQKLFYAMPQQPARESMEAGNVESIESISANHNNSFQTLEDEGLNINTSDTLSLVEK